MATFDTLAPQVISRLSQDLNLTPQQAAGIVGQLGHESGGLQAINEISPTVPGSRGGFGWAQWTGPRRRQFESWAADNKMDVTDPEANYSFLLHELKDTPERAVLDDIRNTADAQSAGRVFTDRFLRPGVPAYDSRKSWTERALNALIPAAEAGTLPQDGTAQQSMAERIAKAREGGFSDEEILSRLQSNADFSARIQKARDAGFSDDEIFGRLGFSGGAQGHGSTAEMLPDGGMRVSIAHENPAPSAEPQSQSAEGGGFGSGVLMGLRDPIDAGAQMLRRAVPESVGAAIDQAGNYLSGLGFPVAPSDGVEGIDRGINEREQQYQAARQAAGREGMDWARLGGNIAGTAPLMAAAPTVLGAASLPVRMAAGGVQGAALGAMNPVIGDQAQQNFGSSKAGQAGLGAAFGAATPAVTGTIGRLLSPKASRLDSPAKSLMNEGVELTPGQALGGALMRWEDRAMSLPIVGDAIRGARTRGNESLNRAVYNRVLEPIGKSTSKTGREAVDDAARMVSQAYDDVLGKVQFTPDSGFSQSIASLRSMAANLPAKEARSFNNVLQRDVIEPLTKGRSVDGMTFKRIEAQLGERAQQFLKATDAYQNDVGRALLEAQKALRENLARMNPAYAQELQNVNRSFAQLVRLENAAGKIGAQEGIFTPQQLAQAIRQTDRSARKRAYSSGRALMQDLSDAAQSRMSAKVPDSGTTERLLANALAGSALAGSVGFGAVSPAVAIGATGALGAASLPYLPWLSQAATRAITSRPANAQVLAEQLRKLPPGFLGVLAGQ